MKKETTKDKLLERLGAALRSLYHNATPDSPAYQLPRELWDVYDQWFNDVASFEVEYIQDNLGSTEGEYEKAKKAGWPLENERYYYLVSRITEFGKLYTWGRGGRTLAPDKLIKQYGGSSFSPKKADEFEECSNEQLTYMIEVIEAFNTYVRNWNSAENLNEMWKSEVEYRTSELKSEAKDLRKKIKTLAIECRALMGIAGENACNALINTIKADKREHKKLVHQLALYNE